MLEMPEVPSIDGMLPSEQAIYEVIREKGPISREKAAAAAGYSERQTARLLRDGGRLASVGVRRTAAGYVVDGTPPPLTDKQQAALDIIQECGGLIPAEQVVEALRRIKINVSLRSIHRWCGPGGPLAVHSVTATGRGYYLPEAKIGV